MIGKHHTSMLMQRDYYNNVPMPALHADECKSMMMSNVTIVLKNVGSVRLNEERLLIKM